MEMYCVHAECTRRGSCALAYTAKKRRSLVNLGKVVSVKNMFEEGYTCQVTSLPSYDALWSYYAFTIR